MTILAKHKEINKASTIDELHELALSINASHKSFETSMAIILDETKCSACNGEGDFPYYNGLDIVYRTCLDCNGRGFK